MASASEDAPIRHAMMSELDSRFISLSLCYAGPNAKVNGRRCGAATSLLNDQLGCMQMRGAAN